MSKNKSKDKGTRFENEIKQLALKAGLQVRRPPLSGAYKDGVNEHDLIIDHEGYECKARANGFKQIYKWKEGNEGVFIKSDYKTPLVVIEASFYLELLKWMHG